MMRGKHPDGERGCKSRCYRQAVKEEQFRRNWQLFENIMVRYRSWDRVPVLLRELGLLARKEPQNPLFPVYQAQCSALLGRTQMARAYLMEADLLKPGPQLQEAIRRAQMLMGAVDEGSTPPQ